MEIKRKRSKIARSSSYINGTFLGLMINRGEEISCDGGTGSRGRSWWAPAGAVGKEKCLSLLGWRVEAGRGEFPAQTEGPV